MLLLPDDDRLGWLAPQPVDTARAEVRLERFPARAGAALAGQIGPLANLRSAPGCGVRVVTDSPWIALRLARLRHHQMTPQSLAVTVGRAGEAWSADSGDLREREGELRVLLPTGLERGAAPGTVTAWLPPISTCAIAGVELAEGAIAAAPPAEAPRLLCLGDSLVQGFSCQSPLHPWPMRLAQRLGVAHWNLGVGGIRHEAEAFAWALDRPWELVVVGLGSNLAWRGDDLDAVADRLAPLADAVCRSPAARVAWCLPPWKPCEDGKGPPEFMGLALDAEQGRRFAAVRERVAAALARYAPRLELVGGELLPRDHRAFPDGLHPFAPGFARYAEGVAAALHL